MRLTRKSDYCLRILMFCAASGNRVSRVSDIAAAYQVGQPFIFKLLGPLVSAGIVETTRGRNGGVRLGRPPSQITIGEVIRLTEDTLSLADCFEDDGPECPLETACQLRGVFSRALDAFLEVLDDTTIDDLSKPSAAVVNLLAQIEGSDRR
ncbi:MAG: Rrf2 family transcriptional regulator [Pseudomonadota bacterium]